MMIIQFNSLGVITSTDTSNASFRQGSKGEVIQAVFAGKSNTTHTAKVNFTRPDGTVVQNLVMSPDSSDQSAFLFELDDLWFLAISGNATMTIFLYNDSNVIQAQGQVTIPIESSDYVDEDDVPITTEQYDNLMALVSSKANNSAVVIVVDDISELDMTQFAVGQLFFDKDTDSYYVRTDSSPYYALVGDITGVLGSSRMLVRYIVSQGQITLQSLYDLNDGKQFILGYYSPSNQTIIDYLCQFQLTSGAVSGIRAVRLSDLCSWYASITNLPLSSNFSALLVNTYLDRIMHQENLAYFAVPYTGAIDDVDLGNHKLTAQSLEISSSLYGIYVSNSNLWITTGYGNIVLAPEYNLYYGPISADNEVATHGYVATYAETYLVDKSSTQTITGQKTFTGRAVFSGDANLYNTYLTTNTKTRFARVGITTGQYVNYDLPYAYGDVGAGTYTIATTDMLARANLVSIIQEASQSLNGLMSATDKSHLDALYSLLGEESDADTVVNTINEVLAIFNNYPEGTTIIQSLALKVDIADIINNLTSDETAKPLSAYQGKVLKGLIDALDSAKANASDVYEKSDTYSQTEADDLFRTENQVDTQINAALANVSNMNVIADIPNSKNYNHQLLIRSDGELVLRLTEIE